MATMISLNVLLKSTMHSEWCRSSITSSRIGSNASINSGMTMSHRFYIQNTGSCTQLHGSHSHTMSYFPTMKVPSDSQWSITIYDVTDNLDVFTRMNVLFKIECFYSWRFWKIHNQKALWIFKITNICIL